MPKDDKLNFDEAVKKDKLDKFKEQHNVPDLNDKQEDNFNSLLNVFVKDLKQDHQKSDQD
jgi:hypothetical protein